MSKMYLPTLREVPAEAELPSHKLLLRAGMIKRLASGIYTYLPLGYRTIRKIENIVREEMNNVDSQEVLMSAIIPSELWKETGRWEDFGPEMFKLYDRHNREFCLGPTHEEVFTETIRGHIKSYKQLPLSLYQIQTKYRDEKRPRFGLMRAREFIMKDAYTFDIDEQGMKDSYETMWKAYEKIFTRCGIDYRVVEGDSGAMGGSGSHEFTAMSEFGESTIVYCDKCDYAATDEKAECNYEIANNEEELEMKKIETPGITTIEDLSSFLNVKGEKLAKIVMLKVKDEIIGVMVPGDRELNEVKLINLLGVAEHDIEMADEVNIRSITNADPGFSGPIGLKENIKIYVDKRITQMKNFIVGANETDMHYKNVNYGRDFKGEVLEDVLLTGAEDNCPKCSGLLIEDKGIEVGNIFQLGTKYSDALGAKYLDENGKEQSLVMGSHGIGVSRTMAASVEQGYDDDGIIWPMSIAPYQVIITIISTKKEEQVELGETLYAEFKSRGIEVLLDDRDERAGVKFKDADLIGIPLRVIVGKRANENIVEFSERIDREKEELNTEELITKIDDLIKENLK